MRFDIITLFPEIIDNYCKYGIVGRAFENKIAQLSLIQLRNFGIGKYKKVDDEIFGGGVGMLLKPEPLFAAHRSITKEANFKTILLTPSGQTLNQPFIRKKLLPCDQLIILCGRYEGFDERVKSLVDYSVSLGNYILSGGEIGALTIIDSLIRLLPGALPKGEQVHGHDSFSDEAGQLLEAPQYTRPAEFEGLKVPDILLSGNHQAISDWKKQYYSL